MIPPIIWTPITSVRELDWNKGKNARDDSPHEIIWDGDVSKLNRDYLNANIPASKSFWGGTRAHVGDLEIGIISIGWNAHQRNWPNRLTINGYSFLHPQKKNGGYGRRFDDEVPMSGDRTVFTRDASFDEAKAYVEGAFLDMLAKAGIK